MECVELAPAVGCVARFESGSKLHALHTLRAVWFRLCRPEDRRALPRAVTEACSERFATCDPISFFSSSSSSSSSIVFSDSPDTHTESKKIDYEDDDEDDD